ncbi:MAG: conjugal transfer protein TraF [Gammaproteobacteria bacterium]|nr:conjugal transfer protein TraF [Gammaproteobacteria bacterium]
MIKRLSGIALLMGVLPVTALAFPSYQPLGPVLGYGNVSIPQELLTLTQNPAAPAAAHGDKGYRLHSALSLNTGISFEQGNLGAAQDEFDALNAYDLSNIQPTEINAIATDLNSFFSAFSDSFLLKTNLGTSVPLFPLITGTSNFGSVYLSADFTSQFSARYLDTPVQISGPTSIGVTGALYAKAAYRGDLALGYSRRLMQTSFGELYLGGRYTMYSVGTNKTLAAVSVDVATNTVTDSIPSNLDFATTTASDFDLGVMLKADKYQAGLTLANLTSASFAYPTIGQNCASLPTQEEIDACYIAVAHSDEISLSETHVMTPQLRSEGAILGAGGNFIVAASLDLNAINDMLGDPVQYLTLSSAYAIKGWGGLLVPRFRMGLRKNLVGSGLTELNIGLSLFKILTLDVAQSTNTTTFEGSTMPRSLRVNLGIGFNF